MCASCDQCGCFSATATLSQCILSTAENICSHSPVRLLTYGAQEERPQRVQSAGKKIMERFYGNEALHVFFDEENMFTA